LSGIGFGGHCIDCMVVVVGVVVVGVVVVVLNCLPFLRPKL
jgi:hypothetical protein